ncbi:MAG: aldehyde dehydrogenase family protein [Polyangiaceae bacterium]
MASPKFPEPPPQLPPTPLAEVDKIIDKLHAKKDAWVEVGVGRRIQLLERCIQSTLDCAEAWVADACRAKGIPADSPQAGEEWLGGPVTTVRNMRLLIEALRYGGVRPAPKMTTLSSGQVVAQVFPATALDKIMMGGISAEVWIEPGQEPSQGRIYREKNAGKTHAGKVSLVLGAGNVASIGPMDALYKLFAEDEVVLLKTNPVNAYLGPHFEAALRPLADEGFFAVVHGGAEVGQHCVNHAKIETIHMTGSDRTHDAIVWGPTVEEQARRKASHEPRCTKPISSELGAVTPVLVVPGSWSEADLQFQARHVASMVANNASFNCNAAKALVLAEGWHLKDRFIAAVKQALANLPARKAYYPGAADRYKGFLENYPSAEKLGEPSSDVVPWTVIPQVKAKKGEYALTNEAFCGVLAIVELEASDARTFFNVAIPFANDTMWGSLSCMVLIDPATEKQHKEQFEQALADLRYGGIGVNAWAGVIYGLVVTTWGAFPGHPAEDIQSGRGVVHNAYLFDHPQKSVLRAPFRMSPTPLWFADHKTQAATSRALLAMEAYPGVARLPKLLVNALRG